MKIKCILLLITCISLFSHFVFAITVSGLYQTTVAVSDESVPVRNNALKQALIQVLIKLTGDKQIERAANVALLLEKAAQYVQQYRYQQVGKQDGDTVLKLQVSFDETVLNDAMRNYDVAVWSSERPAILVWMAYAGPKGHQIISFEEDSKYIENMAHRASVRGIPLLFPLLDLQDRSNINASDIWGDFTAPILKASARYNPDVVLIGKLTMIMPDMWEAKWSILIDNLPAGAWLSRGKVAEIALKNGIDQLADKMASHYANIDLFQAETIKIEVVNINSIDDYARALAHLENLQSVRSVQVKQLINDKVIFELISLGGLTVVDQTINLGKILERIISTDDSYSYYLLPR